jgi:hypothetical protein
VKSFKSENEKLMKEHNQINDQMIQILNQLQIQSRNRSGSRQREEGRKHETRDKKSQSFKKGHWNS